MTLRSSMTTTTSSPTRKSTTMRLGWSACSSCSCAGHGVCPSAEIENRWGLMAGLRAAGRQVFAIIPFAVPRYRDRYRA
jgi:hypothetical protein